MDIDHLLGKRVRVLVGDSIVCGPLNKEDERYYVTETDKSRFFFVLNEVQKTRNYIILLK